MFNRTALVIAIGLLTAAGQAKAQSSVSPVAGFDARAQKHRGGVFFTSEDIKKRSPARLSDLFRGQSGITLSTDEAGKVILTSSRGGRTELAGASSPSGVVAAAPPGQMPAVNSVHCVVQVGMDGQMMDGSFSIDDVPASSVHGIELYTGSARVPVEFGAGNNSGCGVVMVWTKTGTDKP